MALLTHSALRREARASAGHGDNGSPGNRAIRPRTNDHECTRVPAMVVRQCSLVVFGTTCSQRPGADRRLRATDVWPRRMEPCRTSRPVTLGDDLEWGHGIVVAPALPVLVEAGVELRLLAL